MIAMSYPHARRILGSGQISAGQAMAPLLHMLSGMEATMNRREVRKEICETIMAAHQDPADWLKAARVMTERLGLDPARCIPLGTTLEIVVDSIMSEAEKQQKTLTEIALAA